VSKRSAEAEHLADLLWFKPVLQKMVSHATQDYWVANAATPAGTLTVPKETRLPSEFIWKTLMVRAAAARA